jgi:hypothetical protein
MKPEQSKFARAYCLSLMAEDARQKGDTNLANKMMVMARAEASSREVTTADIEQAKYFNAIVETRALIERRCIDIAAAQGVELSSNDARAFVTKMLSEPGVLAFAA